MPTHNKNTSEYITETDICTLLLYSDFTTWKQHFVLSEDLVSIWDVENSNLVILTRKAWEKMYLSE